MSIFIRRNGELRQYDAIVRRDGTFHPYVMQTSQPNEPPPPPPLPPPPPPALFIDDCSGSSTSSSSPTGGDDPTFYLEHSGLSITRSGGILKNNTQTNFRMWTKQRFGGPGNNIRVKYRIRATSIFGNDATSIVEGVKLLFKWVAPINPDQGPAGARGIYPWAHPTTGQNMSPGSMQYTPMNYNGYVEISKRHWGSNQYKFPANRRDSIYPVGSYLDLEVTIEWLSNPKALRFTTYINGVKDLQWTDPGTTEAGGEVFNWGVYPGIRADEALFELDHFSIEPLNKQGIALAAWYPGGAKPDGTLLGLQQIARRSYDKFMSYCRTQDGMPAGMPAGAYRIKAPNQGFHPTFVLNATVSEGIGYGMLLSVWMGNPNLPDGVHDPNAQTFFDGFWKYYGHFRNERGLMHWHIGPDGVVQNTGGASDGDFDVAMALVIAHRMWGSGGAVNYGAEATKLINAIRDHEFTPVNYTGVGGPNVMMNGDQWGVDTDHYMPDYFRPGWFREFHKHTGDARWLDIIAKNYPLALGYFWTNFSGGVVPDACTRAGLPRPDYVYAAGYNAVRWFGIAADLLYNATRADALAHGMSNRMITKAKTHWPLGSDVKAPRYDLDLVGPFEAFYNSSGGGMFGVAALTDAAHTKYAAEILAKIDADTELSYFNRGLAAMAAVLMAGIAQPGS